MPNQQAQDQVQAKPAAFAASIILRIRILANGFTSSLNIFDAFQNSRKTRPNVIILQFLRSDVGIPLTALPGRVPSSVNRDATYRRQSVFYF